MQHHRVIIAATAGLETPLAAELSAAGLSAVMVNPRQVREFTARPPPDNRTSVNTRQVREFTQASGRLAKTDQPDAHTLADFGAALNPPLRPLPDAELRQL